jgi:uncharacterized membrane protein (DUF106 family)
MTLPLLAVTVVSIIIGIYPDLIFKPLYSFASGTYVGFR